MVKKCENMGARQKKEPETEEIKAGNTKALSKSGHWTYDWLGIRAGNTKALSKSGHCTYHWLGMKPETTTRRAKELCVLCVLCVLGVVPCVLCIVSCDLYLVLCV